MNFCSHIQFNHYIFLFLFHTQMLPSLVLADLFVTQHSLKITFLFHFNRSVTLNDLHLRAFTMIDRKRERKKIIHFLSVFFLLFNSFHHHLLIDLCKLHHGHHQSHKEMCFPLSCIRPRELSSKIEWSLWQTKILSMLCVFVERNKNNSSPGEIERKTNSCQHTAETLLSPITVLYLILLDFVGGNCHESIWKHSLKVNQSWLRLVTHEI